MVDFRVFSKEVVPYVAADLMCPREESPRSSYGTIMNWLKAKKKKKKFKALLWLLCEVWIGGGHCGTVSTNKPTWKTGKLDLSQFHLALWPGDKKFNSKGGEGRMFYGILGL